MPCDSDIYFSFRIGDPGPGGARADTLRGMARLAPRPGTLPVSGLAPRDRTGQAALAFGERPSVFGRPPVADGAFAGEATVAGWGASPRRAEIRPVAMRPYRRRRR